MFSRNPDWQEQLADAAVTARNVPFRYGIHDCCLWSMHCVDKMCGTHIVRDAVEQFNYHDKDGADAIIDAAGGLIPLLSMFFGESMNGSWAAPGDVVVAIGPDGLSLAGVVIGHHIVAPGPDGVVTLPHSAAVACWRI